jgi:hypothetical protein
LLLELGAEGTIGLKSKPIPVTPTTVQKCLLIAETPASGELRPDYERWGWCPHPSRLSTFFLFF